MGFLQRTRLSVVNKLFPPDRGEEVNTQRRTLMKVFLAAGGAYVAAKTLDAMGLLGGDEIIGSRMFRNFSIIETHKDLTVYDRQSGDAILVFEKD